MKVVNPSPYTGLPPTEEGRRTLCPHSGLSAYRLKKLVAEGKLKAAHVGGKLLFRITDLQQITEQSIERNDGIKPILQEITRYSDIRN